QRGGFSVRRVGRDFMHRNSARRGCTSGLLCSNWYNWGGRQRANPRNTPPNSSLVTDQRLQTDQARVYPSAASPTRTREPFSVLYLSFLSFSQRCPRRFIKWLSRQLHTSIDGCHSDFLSPYPRQS